MILAGGEGKRLAPLTRDRAKPAVPFGGRYRIVDFVLNNLVNSGLMKIKVLTQFKSNSLIGGSMGSIRGERLERNGDHHHVSAERDGCKDQPPVRAERREG